MPPSDTDIDLHIWSLISHLVEEVPELMLVSFMEAFQPEWDVVPGEMIRCQIGAFTWTFPISDRTLHLISGTGWAWYQQQAMLGYLDWILEERTIEVPGAAGNTGPEWGLPDGIDWGPAVDRRPGDTLEYTIDVSSLDSPFRRQIVIPWSSIAYSGEEMEPMVEPEEIPDVTDQDRVRWSRVLDAPADPFVPDDSGGGISTEELMELMGEATEEWKEMKEEL